MPARDSRITLFLIIWILPTWQKSVQTASSGFSFPWSSMYVPCLVSISDKVRIKKWKEWNYLFVIKIKFTEEYLDLGVGCEFISRDCCSTSAHVGTGCQKLFFIIGLQVHVNLPWLCIHACVRYLMSILFFSE